jgi:uncharacterized protein
MLGQGQQYIGIVTNLKAENYKAYLLVHSIGAGTRVENILFQWPIIGHYRYFASQKTTVPDWEYSGRYGV